MTPAKTQSPAKTHTPAQSNRMRIPRSGKRGMSVPVIGALISAALIATTPVPAMAQDDGNTEARLRRAEAEIRALQRAVFPGGDGRFFEPQIAPQTQNPQQGSANPSTPSTTALTNVLARLDAIEAQLQRLTALSEENSNMLAGLEERVALLETQPASPQLPATAAIPSAASPDPLDEDGATDANLAAMIGGSAQGSAPAVTAPGPSPERIAAVRAITKPQTEDPGDDEYSYGFRLWDAGFYPEARQQLASYIEQYPDHFRLTYGRNLLGRAFLDDGMPEEAARWFLRNYQADRTARRAPDSLLFLAEAMIAMQDTRRACIALAEFAETYPAVATGRLADQYSTNLARVDCPAP